MVSRPLQGRLGTAELRARHCVLATRHPSRPSGRRPRAGDCSSLRAVVYGPYVSAASLTTEGDPRPWDRCNAIATPGRAFNIFFQCDQHRPVRGAPGGGVSIMVFSPASSRSSARVRGQRNPRALTCATPRRSSPALPPLCRHTYAGGRSAWRTASRGEAFCRPLSTRPLAASGFAGDYLGTFYTETAITTGWRAADGIPWPELAS